MSDLEDIIKKAVPESIEGWMHIKRRGMGDTSGILEHWLGDLYDDPKARDALKDAFDKEMERIEKPIREQRKKEWEHDSKLFPHLPRKEDKLS